MKQSSCNAFRAILSTEIELELERQGLTGSEE